MIAFRLAFRTTLLILAAVCGAAVLTVIVIMLCGAIR